MKNAYYAQSGGVTSVINCSAYGLVTKLQKLSPETNVFASNNGINGLLEDRLYDLSKTVKPLSLLAESPGAMFGSCRTKLPDLNNIKFYENIFKKLSEKSIRYFFYNGGNDSADTCLKISQASKILGYELNAISIPKTIDNDLMVTDNCPGFGSVAKYVATSAKEASLDVKSMCKTSTKVFILEVMGRNAGWIAASAELANSGTDIYVHKILVPEVVFDAERFISGVSNDVDEFGFCVVVASEGLKDKSNNFFSNVGESDTFGHVQLGGVAPKLANLIQTHLGFKHHWSVSDYLQRSARHLASKVDVEQAIAVGEYAAELAVSGKTELMPIIKRLSNSPYAWEISQGELSAIANKEKILPSDFIRDDGFRMSKKGVEYLSPLIQGEIFPKFKNGVPEYEQLDLHM